MQWPLFGSLYISVFVYQHLDFSFGCKSSCKMVSIWYVSWLLHLAFCLTFSNIFNQMIHTIFVCCASILMFHHMVNLESLKFIIRLACVCVCVRIIHINQISRLLHRIQMQCGGRMKNHAIFHSNHFKTWNPWKFIA